MGKSLEEFAAESPRRRPGMWVESIPEHDEIVEAWNKGVTPTTIVRWLRDVKGYTDATESKVGNYLRTHHPRR